MYLGTMHTAYIENKDGFTIMDVNLDYYPQEYAEPGYKPYKVSYTDLADIDSPYFCEESEIGSYDTKAEARAVFDEIIEKAGEYAKSLFFPVYSFDDYLIFTQEG